MPFFSSDDYENIDKTNQVPDGLIQGDHYYNVFENFLTELEFLDLFDYQSKVRFMMNIVNPVTNNDGNIVDANYVFDLITCMSFHIVQLFLSGENTFDSFKERYLKAIREDILPVIKAECEALPYWE